MVPFLEVKNLWSHFISLRLLRGLWCVLKATPSHLYFITVSIRVQIHPHQMEWIDAWKRLASKRCTLLVQRLLDVCDTAWCNEAFWSPCLALSQSTPTGFATGWPPCAPQSSLRPRGSLKMPGRFPGSPCDWSWNWARAALERFGWVRATQTRRAGTCSENSSRCCAFV